MGDTEGNQTYSPLANVSFKIYSDVTVPGDPHKVEGQNWVYHRTNPTLYPDGPIVDFTNDFNKAEIFTTDENGEIVIDGLYTDFNNYTLVEVPTEANGNIYYVDPINLADEYNNGNAGRMTIDGEEYCTIENVEIGDNTEIPIEIVDNPTYGNLKIIKTGTNNPDRKLRNVEIKILS